MQMLELMGDIAMEEYGEIVVLQSCWIRISLVLQNLKIYQIVIETLLALKRIWWNRFLKEAYLIRNVYTTTVIVEHAEYLTICLR